MGEVVIAAILVGAAPGGVASAPESSFENTRHNSRLKISRRTGSAISALSYLSFSSCTHVGEPPDGT
jgi:hypothetical protein